MSVLFPILMIVGLLWSLWGKFHEVRRARVTPRPPIDPEVLEYSQWRNSWEDLLDASGHC